MAEYTVTSFASGELAPRFYGRFDIPQYRTGARKLRNVIVTPEGAAMRRQGTKYVATAYDSTSEVAYLKLQHSSRDATLIEAGNSYFRFIKDGQIIEMLTGLPYTGDQVRELQYVPWGAYKMYIVHPSHAPAILRYDPSAATQWTYEQFVGSDEGSGLRFKVFNWGNGLLAGEYDSGVTYGKGDFATADDDGTKKIYKSISEDNKDNDPVTSSTHWEFYKEASQAPSTDYDFAFDQGAGKAKTYPKCVSVYASRLILGGSDAFPNSIFGSAVSLGSEEYAHNFKPDIVNLSAEDAWYNPIYSAEYEEMVWLTSEQVLLAGTSNGLWRLGGPENPIQGTTSQGAMLPLRQSSVGCAPTQPVMYGGLIVFVEAGERRVRATSYQEAQQKYSTMDLTALSYHLTESGVVRLALQRRPFMILWAVTRDGGVLSFSFSQETGTSAWSKHSFSGAVEDIEVVPGEHTDEVWVVVKREIEGSYVRHIEFLEVQEQLDPTELNFVDSWVRWDGGDPVDIAEVYGDEYDPAQVHAASSIDGVVSDGTIVRILETGASDLDGHFFFCKNIDTDNDTFDLYELGGAVNFTLDTGDAGNPITGGKFEVVSNGVYFDHLNGRDIHGLVDETTVSPTKAGTNLGPKEEGDGATFHRYGNRIIMGLPYFPEVQTLNIAQNPSQKKRISEIYLHVLDSGAVQLGPSPDWLETVIFDREGFVFGKHTEVYTGDRMKEFPGTWSQTGSVYLTQKWPLPLTLISFVAEVTGA